ncbi:TPA: helix-turn-helix transcriptional regulator [Stenotrophomonas maltophilia]|nr:helix-turn-helix transcriptional regulator [Stenotrophomonas maltophilia]
MSNSTPVPRGVVAARLRQARHLRGLSQREVGVRMGLDKDTASARISRYESESMTVSLESLFALANALEVPPAYLVAGTSAMADAILCMEALSEKQQRDLGTALASLTELTSEQRQDFIAKITSAGTEA